MKTWVFDFDGTLVDSMPYWLESVLLVLKNRQIPFPADLGKVLTPLGYYGSARYFREHYGLTEEVEDLVNEMKGYAFPAYRDVIPAKETVVETLFALKEKGYSLNVLTASPHTTLDACLKRVGLFDVFNNVWSCDDFHTTKADINIYRMVAEKLGTTVENCFFFGRQPKCSEKLKSGRHGGNRCV